MNIPTRKGKVLLLGLEEIASELQKNLIALGATEADDIKIFCGRAPIDCIEQLAKIAEEEKPALIVIDPIMRAARVKDTNDYAAVSNLFDGLMEVARESKAHIVCVHHAGKGERTGADAILGSTAFHGAGDASIVVSRQKDLVKIESFQRYGKGIPATTLKFNPQNNSFTVGDTFEQFESNQNAEKIVSLLLDAPEPLTQKEILEAIEIRKSEAMAALSSLVRANEILRSGKGGKADPYRYSIHVPTLYGEPQTEMGDF